MKNTRVAHTDTMPPTASSRVTSIDCCIAIPFIVLYLRYGRWPYALFAFVFLTVGFADLLDKWTSSPGHRSPNSLLLIAVTWLPALGVIMLCEKWRRHRTSAEQSDAERTS